MKTKNLVKPNEDWVNRKWRPAMAWTYIAICIFDFILGPILNWRFFGASDQTFAAWKPLTMSDGGMFHIAMGAILGITAWTRGQEKMTRPSYDRYSHYDRMEEYEEPTDYRDRITADPIGKNRP